MIQVSNLYKSYGRQVIFDGAGFTLNAGERAGLVGRNGHGKTTLFRLIMGEEHPDEGVIGIPADYSIGHLSQHIRFKADTVLQEGCLSLRPAEDGRDETFRVEKVLLGLGFSSGDFARPPHELSGGYQVRLNLAKVLIREPNLLLLDEPTNYLDIVSIRWLTHFLRNWKNELILITHDRDFMDGVTTHTMGIHRSKIRKIAGSTHKLYDQIIQEEEVHERTRLNDERRRKETEQFINRFRAQANKARAVQSRIKALQKKERLDKLETIRNLDFAFDSAPFTGKQLIEAKDVCFSFERSGPLIDSFCISVGKGDRIAVIGKNGRGKTTLLNLLSGGLSPSSGGISYHPQLSLAYFGQTNIDRLDPKKTVEEEIMDSHPDHSRGQARNVCGAMMFEGDNALKRISVLSGGEKSRVLLGKLLVSPANLLFLDEPTNHLDMESIDSLIEAIDAFSGAVVIVTHSEMILHSVAQRLIVFDGGKISVFDGTYRDFLEKVGWEDETNAVRETEKIKDGAPNRKELRRAKAQLIAGRSRVISPLQKGIRDLEERIMRLEEKIGEDTKALLDASVKGDGGPIRALSKSIHEAKQEIDLLFEQLAEKTEELEARSREFEEKMTETQ